MTVDYTAEMAHAAAARGAEWLDEKCPRWAGEIDVDWLDLAEPDRCILGQTAECLIPPEEIVGFPDFFDVLNYLGRAPTSLWAIDVGFDVPKASQRGTSEYQTTSMRYEMLTIAWRELIRERLAAPA